VCAGACIIVINMSSTEQMDEVCASCGKAAVDNIKLKLCTACKLVKYCSVECQKNHRKQHKKACKKRVAEIRDDLLMEQPDGTWLGDCEICCLPLPLDLKKSSISSCCSKRICQGCTIANYEREREQLLEHRCPFCRHPVPTTNEEAYQNEIKRIEANDPLALLTKGEQCWKEGNYGVAFEYWSKSAGLGNIGAHYRVSLLYQGGRGVEKDEKKEIYHLEEAAIGGHPSARYSLACAEIRYKRYERAQKHFIIAAKLGDEDGLEAVKDLHAKEEINKVDHDAAVRGYQAAIDATKSEQREAADEFWAAERIRDAFVDMMRNDGVPETNITTLFGV
jgi:hypothetical protein